MDRKVSVFRENTNRNNGKEPGIAATEQVKNRGYAG